MSVLLSIPVSILTPLLAKISLGRILAGLLWMTVVGAGIVRGVRFYHHEQRSKEELGDRSEGHPGSRDLLAHSPEHPVSETVAVALAANDTQAQMMKGVLENAGIPVVIRRPAGSDLPDLMSAGSREILVHNTAYEAAKEILEDTTGTRPLL